MTLTKIKRPDAVIRLKSFLNGDNMAELTTMELRQLLTYITALEDANIALQPGTNVTGEKGNMAFRSICYRHWCKRVHYGATKQEAQTNAEQCNHLPKAQ